MNRTELVAKLKEISYQLLSDKGFVCSVEILCELDVLSKSQINDWRLGKIQYLEKACSRNLATLSFINLTIKEIAQDLKLKPSWTAYNKYGRGEKTRLIFSKSKDENIEDAYATHYIDKERIGELKREKAGS